MTYYVYDVNGQRMRKVTERQAGSGSATTPTRMHQVIYLGGFGVTCKYAGDGTTLTLNHTALDISVGNRPIARFELRIHGTDDSLGRLIRSQLDNHQGSSSIELDDQGRLISCKEYFPLRRLGVPGGGEPNADAKTVPIRRQGA
jgi:hypothetical protein